MFIMEAFGKESAPAAEQPDATVLDASTLKPEESLAGRDLHGWRDMFARSHGAWTESDRDAREGPKVK